MTTVGDDVSNYSGDTMAFGFAVVDELPIIAGRSPALAKAISVNSGDLEVWKDTGTLNFTPLLDVPIPDPGTGKEAIEIHAKALRRKQTIMEECDLHMLSKEKECQALALKLAALDDAYEFNIDIIEKKVPVAEVEKARQDNDKITKEQTSLVDARRDAQKSAMQSYKNAKLALKRVQTKCIGEMAKADVTTGKPPNPPQKTTIPPHSSADFVPKAIDLYGKITAVHDQCKGQAEVSNAGRRSLLGTLVKELLDYLIAARIEYVKRDPGYSARVYHIKDMVMDESLCDAVIAEIQHPVVAAPPIPPSLPVDPTGAAPIPPKPSKPTPRPARIKVKPSDVAGLTSHKVSNPENRAASSTQRDSFTHLPSSQPVYDYHSSQVEPTNIIDDMPELNGVIEAGIAANSDPKLPMSHRLPVDVRLKVSDAAIMSAAWALDAFAHTAVAPMYALLAFCVVITGMTQYGERGPDGDWYERAWELPEVDNVYSTHGDTLKLLLTPENVSQGISIVVGTKLNWWMTNHHIGTGRATSYIKKLLNHLFTHPWLNIHEPDQVLRDAITTCWHKGGHWASTRYLVGVGALGIRGVRPTTCPFKSGVAVIVVSRDIEIRAAGPPAGTHRHAIAYAICKVGAHSNHFMCIPGIEDLLPVIAGYRRIMAIDQVEAVPDRARYHTGADYLAVEGKVPNFQDEPAAQVLGRLGSFIAITRPKNTINSSPHINGDLIGGQNSTDRYKSYEDFNDPFHNFLINSTRSRIRLDDGLTQAIAGVTNMGLNSTGNLMAFRQALGDTTSTPASIDAERTLLNTRADEAQQRIEAERQAALVPATPQVPTV